MHDKLVPLLAFLPVFLASALILLRPSSPLRSTLPCCGIALVAAALSGLVSIPALLVILAGLALAILARHATGRGRKWLLAALAIWALVAALHAWPGFQPLLWTDEFGRHAQALRWHVDKMLAGFFLLLALQPVLSRIPADCRWLIGLAGGTAAILASCLLLNFALLEPRLQQGLPLWLTGNLFITVVAEEAFFRGLLQARLQEWFAKSRSWRGRHAYPLAVTLCALLFGLVHLPWGWAFAFIASFAGLFYGVLAGPSMRFERAIAGHFLVNASLIVLTRSPLG